MTFEEFLVKLGEHKDKFEVRAEYDEGYDEDFEDIGYLIRTKLGGFCPLQVVFGEAFYVKKAIEAGLDYGLTWGIMSAADNQGQDEIRERLIEVLEL